MSNKPESFGGLIGNFGNFQSFKRKNFRTSLFSMDGAYIKLPNEIGHCDGPQW